MNYEVLFLSVAALAYAFGVALAWLMAPWWAALVLTLLLAPVLVAFAFMAVRESR